MELVLKAAAVYFLLLVILRVMGRRSLGNMTAFDFILLLIMSEAVQNALVGRDTSLTGALLVVVTLVGIDLVLSLCKERFPALGKVVDGVPTILLRDGKPLAEPLAKSRVDEEDILLAAREKQGLERLDQIKYAVLERAGGISVIPK